MKKPESKIENDVQDRSSLAWKKLCQYVDEIAESGSDEFVPRAALGNELFAQIYTLPETISKLKKVTKIGLYGSALKRIPPEIGEMESLEYFDPYTSYSLNWFPYEIMECKKLKDSRISTRALFGNYKNRKEFPSLKNNPIRYFGETVKCSICKKEITYQEIEQLWITLRTGTDTIPLLANICSSNCRLQIPEIDLENSSYPYLKNPHKGGSDLSQPPTGHEIWQMRRAKMEEEKRSNNHQTNSNRNSQNPDDTNIKTVKVNFKDLKPIENLNNDKKDSNNDSIRSGKTTDKKIILKKFKDLKPLKLIRKIWEK